MRILNFKFLILNLEALLSLQVPTVRGNLRDCFTRLCAARNDNHRWLIFAFALCFFTPTSLFANEKPPILVKAEVDKAAITIGDPVNYTVTIKTLPEVQLLSLIPPPPKDVFRVKKIEDINTTEGEYTVKGKNYILTTFRLGKYILDPIEIKYRISGGELQTITTDKLFIRVESVAGDEEKQDIRGIKSVLSVAQKLLKWLLIILGTGLVLFLIFLFIQARKKKLANVIPEPALSAEEEALQNLTRLYESDLIRNGQYKQYYLIFSEILRIYFERRFQILAVEATTHEIMQSLKGKPIAIPLKDKIRAVLEASDLAKFAKWKPEPTKIIELNKQAKEIIEESKPKEEPKPAPEDNNGV